MATIIILRYDEPLAQPDAEQLVEHLNANAPRPSDGGVVAAGLPADAVLTMMEALADAYQHTQAAAE